MAVLAEISNWGIANLVTWDTALCHDVLEDCPDIEYADIVHVIGPVAAEVVKELSFFPDSSDTKAVQKGRYLASFSEKSIHALVCKVADRICNTRDFIEAGDPYAENYWGKAADLLDVMKVRGEEIGQFFKDEKVFPRMEDSACRISMML
jgi:(p)ppGpp synthase/HD superfamily hydrolase